MHCNAYPITHKLQSKLPARWPAILLTSIHSCRVTQLYCCSDVLLAPSPLTACVDPSPGDCTAVLLLPRDVLPSHVWAAPLGGGSQPGQHPHQPDNVRSAVEV
jgi:hypothetical protein